MHALRLMERRDASHALFKTRMRRISWRRNTPTRLYVTNLIRAAPTTTVRRAHARTSRITYPLGPTSRRAGHRVTRTCRGDRVTQLRAAQFPISEPVDASKSHRGGVLAAGCLFTR